MMTLAGIWIAGLTALSGCAETITAEGSFDGPAGAAVLHPETGGPFYEPVGFVTNSRDGRIWALDLKHGWFLTDDAATPFVWGAAVPTGTKRILGDVAVWAPDAERVTLFAADTANEVLVELPWVIGLEADGSPLEVTPRVSAGPTFDDADDSGDAPTLGDLRLNNGAAATEDWRIEYDGDDWKVTGSRSGLQANEARSLHPYSSDEGAISFLISGAATVGDAFTISVDRGAVEHDLGGVIQALSAAPDQSLIFASVFDRETEATRLVAFDPAGGVIRGDVPLPVGAVPYRMCADSTGDLLYVADARSPAVYEVLVDRDAPAASATRAIPTDGPVADVAWIAGEDYTHLFIAPALANRLDVYDLEVDAYRDINPYTPELDGVEVGSPITGLAASPIPVRLPEENTWGAKIEESVVAISTFEGALLLAEGSTGCLAQDSVGPYAYPNADDDFVDFGDGSNPQMLTYDELDYPVEVNPCGGVVRSEDWTATFDEAQGAWVVRGTISGEQAAVAFEDERYLSDDGELSFLILAGAAPSTDGDQFRFTTVEGVVRIQGDLDGSGAIEANEALELPARPMPFHYLAGPTGGGWDEVNRVVGVLWPLTNADKVVRVNVSTVTVENVWY